MAEQTAHDKLAELIDDIDVAMMTTREADGSMRSRPMMTQNERFEDDLWFFTRLDSAKVEELQMDPQVNLSYSAPSKQRYVSVSGEARVVRDRETMKRFWSPVHRAWFPGGLEDPQLCILRVRPTYAEYWDSPNSAVVHLFGMAKAVVSGEAYEPGENEKIDLDRAS